LAWWYLAAAYRRMNQLEEERRAGRRGVETAERELVRNPRSGEVRAYLSYFCARLGDRARAEAEAAQALRQSPADADARWMAVMTYEELGRREAALAALARAPPALLADLNRWPGAAELRRDRRFLALLAAHGVKPE
jgi:tetratricopeptide (TPR) repeat protein